MRKRAALAAIFFAAAAALLAAEKPSLVVVISVDQMRNDYLDRFRPWFARDGFNRFLQRGARFPEARVRYATTVTCAGHTAIGTGRDPRETGIVANDWYDRANARRQYCVADRNSRWVGPPANAPAVTVAPASPVWIDGDFVGDRFKEKFPGARVVSLSLKDRGAVPMGGRKADAVLWYVNGFQRFVTSSWYPATPLLAFNDRLPAFFASHARWEPSGRIPEKDLARITFQPPEISRFSNPLPGTGDRFPHPLPTSQSVVESPFGDELVLELARYATRELHIGKNPTGAPDLLFLGLSALDYYVHRFGPDSREAADGIVRLDAQLDAFLRWLDSEVGAGAALVFLTADHGVTPIPEVARERARRTNGRGRDDPNAPARIDYGTGPGAAAKVSDGSPDRVALEKHLAAKFGYALDLDVPNSLEGAILRFEEPIGFYLNRAVLARRRLPSEDVKAVVRDWLRGRPGIRAAWTNTEIAAGLPATEPLALPVERAFRADRSPDVVAYLRPGWSFRKEPGAAHGQPNDEDMRVPLLAWGAGVRAGSYGIRVSPESIAKTIGALYGFPAGGEDVEVLQPALGLDEETRAPAKTP